MPTTMINPEVRRQIKILWGSSQTAVSVLTTEDRRITDDYIAAMADIDADCAVITWDRVRGFVWDRLDDHGYMKDFPFGKGTDYTNMLVAMERISNLESIKMKKAIFIFKDPHDVFEDPSEGPACRRVLKTMVNELQLVKAADPETGDPGHKYQAIFVAPQLLHRELLEYVVPLDYPRPTEAEHEIALKVIESGDPAKQGTPETRRALAAIGIGLTALQFENAASKAVTEHGGFKVEALDTVEKEKAKLIAQRGFLHYVPFNDLPAVDHIRGFDEVHEFLGMQSQAYRPNSVRRTDRPKGMLLMGVAGTGKSEMGKLAARVFYNNTGKRFPVYRLDVPALFGGILGETEGNVRWVIETLSAQGYYMLVIDELEKMLATSTIDTDGGASRRVVGQMLTWLSERVKNPNDNGYIIGTLNTIDGIKPEFFRRFSGVFATDLPTPEIRKEIIVSHFQRRGIDVNQILAGADGTPLSPADWDALISGTDQFIGSELEDVVIQSMDMAAFRRNVEIPTFEEVEKTIRDRGTNIVAKTHSLEIQAVREYCNNSARPVYIQKVGAAGRGKRSRQVNTGD